MAISSKISIDVDGAAFTAFQEKFDKYKEALDKTPAQWRNVGAQPVLKITDRRAPTVSTVSSGQAKGRYATLRAGSGQPPE